VVKLCKAEAKAEEIRIKAEAEADVIRQKGKAEADVVQQKGQAETKVIEGRVSILGPEGFLNNNPTIFIALKSFNDSHSPNNLAEIVTSSGRELSSDSETDGATDTEVIISEVEEE